MTTTYTIQTGEGGELATGIERHETAMRRAQEIADDYSPGMTTFRYERGGRYRPLAYIEAECADLAQQLAGAGLKPNDVSG